MPIALFLAAAAAPAPIAPNGPWVVQVEENMCLLERNYPLADRKVTLIFQPLLDLDSMEVFVIAPDRSDQQYDGKYKVNIGAGEPLTGSYYSVRAPKTKMRLTRLSTGRRVLDELKDGDTLRLQARPVNLAFGIVRPDKARAALQRCVEDLKKSWGIDPETQSRVVTPIDGNPGRYFNADSYPAEALSAHIYGRVIALLNINTAGTVEHCRIVSSAGTALNNGTCKVAMRIRFKPARDKNGTALPSTYVLPVRWTMPGAPE